MDHQNGNPVYYDVQATFDGTTISFTDSSGVNHSITYNSSYLAGQNNYKYDSVITQDSSNKDVYYIISQEPSGNLASGVQLDHNTSDTSNWYFGERTYNTSTSTADAFSSTTCFLSGSMIRTPDGDVTVESIQIGDQVFAYDCRSNKDIVRPVVWVGKSHKITRPGLPDDESGWPVRILKNAIANGVPYKDMLITGEHCLFLKEKFVPARMLVNGVSIFYDKSISSYDYYHVETEQHSVITVDGMLTESYLDTGNRSSFRQEGKITTLRSVVKNWEDDAEAPLAVAREFVEPLFREIEVRAKHAGLQAVTDAPELTADTDLHLEVKGGTLIRPARETNGRMIFMIPTDVESVRIVSNTSRPSDTIGPFVDDRRSLGVLIGDITLFDSNGSRVLTMHLSNGALSGWDVIEESDMRWTNGSALLPLGARIANSFALLSIEIKAAGPYLVSDNFRNQIQQMA